MSDMKQVKVDNWGIYFLQRLKHFFNRTDYCDLTLQFQDNAQLKVHRLVLNACTEYFELLERTCEMYEDCLIMPDDLQADVVVPIINFMYTGQLEFKPDLLERLYQTSQVMNMPVLSKLLLAQKQQIKTQHRPSVVNNVNKRSFSSAFASEPVAQSSQPHRKSYNASKKYVMIPGDISEKKRNTPNVKTPVAKTPAVRPSSVKIQASKSAAVHPAAINIYDRPIYPERKRPALELADPRPTRYEVPEELADNIYDDSFSLMSYESKPLMVHPETSKRYGAKKPSFGIFSDTSLSKYSKENSTIDVVECRKIPAADKIYESADTASDSNMFDSIIEQPNIKNKLKAKNPQTNQLFDQILETSKKDGPSITIESKDSKEAANIDHAKIISEVLKKYPHLVKGNKNIKLKILDTKPKVEKKPLPKKMVPALHYNEVKVKTEKNDVDYTYETEVIDSKEAARLISLGAENVKGPWICLICGTPGRALHFPTYHQFRRHLVDVHREKIIPNICEYCGIKSNKRNHLLYHLLTKHGVSPPAHVKFPKCNLCNYIALTESFLAKHKVSHNQEKFLRCNVCLEGFYNSSNLLEHIQATGHKIKFSSNKKTRCVYCLKEFIKENNLYAHLVSRHKDMATRDGIIDGSDDERSLKDENTIEYESAEEDTKEFNIQINQKLMEKPYANNVQNTSKQRILNVGYDNVGPKQSLKNTTTSTINNSFEDNDFMGEEIEVVLPESNVNEEMLIQNVEFEQQSQSTENEEFLVDIQQQHIQFDPSTSKPQIPRAFKKSGSTSQELQIVVSSADELKTLMSTNHPIIFDQDGHANKTLAVLTTPQCSTMATETAINLHTNNPNEVMILPDQYAINVSEAVSTNNSNIVVVYSDELDQGKQYIMDPSFAQGQLVTTDGVATHFVQTSAVITPNFSTVPQEMPVAQPGTWQAIEKTTEAQNIMQKDLDEQVNTDSKESYIVPEMTNLEELTEIAVTSGEQEIVNEDQSEQIHEESSSAVIISNQQTTQYVVENPTNMDVDESFNEEAVHDSACVTNDNVEQSAETVEETSEHLNSEQVQASEMAVEGAGETQEIIEEITGEKLSQNNDIVHENTTNEIVLTEINKDITVGDVAPVPIANLTSEWSEGDDDDENLKPRYSDDDKNPSQPTEIAHAEVEESIENIQEEVNKTYDSEVAVENLENDVKIGNTDEMNAQQEEEIEKNATVEEGAINPPIAEPQENISTLLSDWNENDSQGENGDVQEEIENENEIENGDHVTEVEAAAEPMNAPEETPAREPPVEEVAQIKKPDNIRSLVSDWDEDDEDSKA